MVDHVARAHPRALGGGQGHLDGPGRPLETVRVVGPLAGEQPARPVGVVEVDRGAVEARAVDHRRHATERGFAVAHLGLQEDRGALRPGPDGRAVGPGAPVGVGVAIEQEVQPGG